MIDLILMNKSGDRLIPVYRLFISTGWAYYCIIIIRLMSLNVSLVTVWALCSECFLPRDAL